MERLTEKRCFDNFGPDKEIAALRVSGYMQIKELSYVRSGDIVAEYEDCYMVGEAVDKLAAYEDLGFTPEEIAIMAKFYKERTSAEAIAEDMKIVAKLCELSKYKEAEEQGLLLLLPCKVGDILYAFSFEEIYSFAVRKIETNKYEKTILLKYDGELEQFRFWEIRAGFSDVDTKFFRTKEEAEKALAERSKE